MDDYVEISCYVQVSCLGFPFTIFMSQFRVSRCMFLMIPTKPTNLRAVTFAYTIMPLLINKRNKAIIETRTQESFIHLAIHGPKIYSFFLFIFSFLFRIFAIVFQSHVYSLDIPARSTNTSLENSTPSFERTPFHGSAFSRLFSGWFASNDVSQDQRHFRTICLSIDEFIFEKAIHSFHVDFIVR